MIAGLVLVAFALACYVPGLVVKLRAEKRRADAAEARLAALRRHARPDPWEALRRADEDVRGMGT